MITKVARRNEVFEKGLLVACVVLLCGAGISLLRSRDHFAEGLPRPSGVAEGVDSVLAVLVRSDCNACSRDEVVVELSALLTKIHQGRGPEGRLRLMGVGAGQIPTVELEFLERLASFDEIAVGGGWSNLAVGDLVISDTAGFLGFPQLVLVTRDLSVVDGDLTEATRTVQSVAVGTEAVLQWLRWFSGGGAP